MLKLVIDFLIGREKKMKPFSLPFIYVIIMAMKDIMISRSTLNSTQTAT